MKRLVWVLAAFALSAFGVSSCDNGGGHSIDVATFNAGLATGFVDYAPERTPLIGPAVSKLGADVICLEEVWEQPAIDQVLADTKAAYPYSYHEVTSGDTGSQAPACQASDTAALEQCVLDSCSDVQPSELGGCALANCKDEFVGLPKDCGNCVAANIGNAGKAASVQDAVDQIVGACQTAGNSYAYDGRNGLILLSRYPLSNKEFKRFDSYLNVRVALHAVVQDPGLGDTDVYCTHLTADLTDVPYAGDFDSWGAEQAKEIDDCWPGWTRPRTRPGPACCWAT